MQADRQKKAAKKDKGKGRAREALPASLNFFGDATKARESDDEGEGSGSESDSSTSSSSSATAVPEPPRQKITLSGPDPLPASLGTDLESLFASDDTLQRPLLRNLAAANIRSLWGVQCAVGGSLLAGHDTLCVAPTGSGKTLAYLLPLLVLLKTPSRKLADKDAGIRALVVVPTHDLAVQIHQVLGAILPPKWRALVLSKATQKAVCEAAPGPRLGKSDDSGEESDDGEDEEQREGNLGIDFLITTPERLHHLLDDGQVSLAK